MGSIPAKCPKCGRTKAWKEEVNIFTSGVYMGPLLGRVRFGVPKGLLARPLRKAMGCYTVTYRCHNCGFLDKYPIDD